MQCPGWRDALAYALLSAAAVYAHFFALLVIAAHLCSAPLAGPRRAPWQMVAVSTGGLLLLLIPFAWFSFTHSSTVHIEWVQDLSRGQLMRVLYSLTLNKLRSLCYMALWFAAVYAFVGQLKNQPMGLRILFCLATDSRSADGDSVRLASAHGRAVSFAMFACFGADRSRWCDGSHRTEQIRRIFSGCDRDLLFHRRNTLL